MCTGRGVISFGNTLESVQYFIWEWIKKTSRNFECAFRQSDGPGILGRWFGAQGVRAFLRDSLDQLRNIMIDIRTGLCGKAAETCFGQGRYCHI